MRTDPFPCPADGCDYVAEFMTAAHLILVWQVSDDPNLLRHAQRAKEVGRNPRVIAYEQTFGPNQSTELLFFLVRVLENTIRAWLDLPE